MKPMLATEVNFDKLQLPVFVSLKLDGIRAVVVDGVVMSRSMKPIRNKYVQELFGKPELNGLDGELVVGDIFAPDVFQLTTSGVMSEEGEPDVLFYVFDDYSNPKGYLNRCVTTKEKAALNNKVRFLNQDLVSTLDNIKQMMEDVVLQGGEGLILRSPDGKYKQGRSTVKEGYLLKLKFFVDDEFEIVGFEERYHNTNTIKINELGYTERSSAKDGLIPMGTLGSLVLKFGNDTFKCGTGFNDELRQSIWNNKDKYIGQLAKIRYMSVGMKDLPRVPSFKGIRDRDDLS